MKITHTSFLAMVLLTALESSHSFAQSGNQPATPADMVNALHAAFGDHHARAVHAKGIILEGEFQPDEQAATLTKAFHLQKQSSRVVVRFSNFTGIPDIPDNVAGANPRGMAIKFTTPDGTNTDIVCHSFNGFPVPTSEEFRLLLLSIGSSGPNATKPTAIDHYVATHPIAKTFLTTQHTPASYSTISYFGVNSFKFTNQRGESHFIRYQCIPMEGEQFLTPEELTRKSPQYLGDEIKTRVAQHPLSFRLFAQVAEEGDQIENPAVAWPDTRRRVLLGTIRIDKLASNTPEDHKGLSFNPGNIPDGIKTADPMLDLRSAAYPISVKERQ